VAVRAHDPEPEAIRARLRDRDAAYQDDFVGVILDTFHDQRRAFMFLANPLGVQMDAVLDEVGGGGEDNSWDAIWDSAGRITATGYEVEMAIPFTSLRFPAAEGAQTWGIDALRIWPRDQTHRFGLVALPRGSHCFLCHAAELTGLEGIAPSRNLELAPTLTGLDVSARADGTEPFDRSREAEAGLTVTWGVTPETTLNATVNPDFSQVEADAAQLAVNTQFALSFPEKRPFFLEGADLFTTRLGAVHTRTIAEPDWGLKVTGKSGSHAYGAIVARDGRTNLLIPESQSTRRAFLDDENLASILRYRRDLGGASAVGALLTSRDGRGYSNRVAGLDGAWRFGTGSTLRLELLGSQTRYPEAVADAHRQVDGTLQGSAVRAVFQRSSRTGLAFFAYNEVSPSFRADLGFVPQAGFRRGFALYERYWHADRRDLWWTRVTAGAETAWSYDHNGNPLEQQVAPSFWFMGPRQSYVRFYLGLGKRWFRGREIDRNFLSFHGELQARPAVFLSLSGRVGQEIDFANAQGGDLIRLSSRARVDVGRSLRLDLAHHYETLEVPGGRLFTAHLSELRSTYQMSRRSFLRLITQRSSVTRDPDLYSFATRSRSTDLLNQLLFSYKLDPRTVLFLGYSDTYFAEEPSFAALEQRNRTLFFKVGYALAL
jgi:hypothetical protein